MTRRASLADRVANGAAWLDARLPYWHEQVDVDELDIRSACRCVLGQTGDLILERAGVTARNLLVDPYFRVLDNLPDPGVWAFTEDSDREAWAVEHGFAAGGWGDPAVYAELKELWLAEVEARFES